MADKNETENWELALKTYNYPVKLADYRNAQNYKGYFKFNPIGNSSSTALFESHFREGASKNIESWLEVIYWKMYSQNGRSHDKTDAVADYFCKAKITPDKLLTKCNNYIADDSRKNLNEIIKLLGFSSNSIAIAATFPAFLRPDLFPMVDTRIAKWVGISMSEQNSSNTNIPQLIRPRYLDTRATVLTLSDMDFVKAWTRWCRHKANQLSMLTNIDWRPRDVEMAVFNAWGNKNECHPKLKLENL